MSPFNFIEPAGKRVPILVSSPHSGTKFPDDIKANFKSELVERPDDTDWFIHQLYDFAPEKGISMITANYSRWVIDLNRTPDSEPLYNDGRIITSLCPQQTFAGEDIYVAGHEPSQAEIKRRVQVYFNPYYDKVQEVLDDLKKEFGYVVLWDGHSIRKNVPLIRAEGFPELTIGDNDGAAAHSVLSGIAIETLKHRGHQVNHNDPFKGGNITRYFGKPDQNQHAIQLEMTKVNYMDDAETAYHPQRASRMRESLSMVFDQILEVGRGL